MTVDNGEDGVPGAILQGVAKYDRKRAKLSINKEISTEIRRKEMKRLNILAAVFALVLFAACGGEQGEENATENMGQSQMQQADGARDQAWNLERLQSEYSEEELRSVYVVLQAYQKATFLSPDVPELTGDLLTDQSEEAEKKRMEIAAEKGKATARRISMGAEEVGFPQPAMRYLFEYANERDWYTELGDRIDAKVEELKAEHGAGEAEAQ